MRATNAGGSSWGTPVTVDATANVGQYTSTMIVNGNPAISYYDVTNGTLKYVRANNADGSSWAAAITVDNAANVGRYSRLAIIDGNPAISYYDVTNGNLKYVRASDASGSTWGTPVTVDATNDVGQYTSLFTVNGNPAIAYYDVTNADLRYVRATNSTGSTWGTPATLESSGNTGQYTSLAVVNGNPAIAYYYATGADLKYIRASDASGTTWGTAVTISTTNDIGTYSSLIIANGRPTIACKEIASGGANRLKYVTASNVNGTAWGTPVTLDATGGAYASALCVDTNIFIGYYSDGVELPSFIRGDITSFTWSGGASSTDWFTTINWEGGMIPTPTINATIPGSLSFYPNISSGTAHCKNLVLSTGATLTVSGGTVQVTDSINNSGTITATSGTIKLTGDNAQVIIAGTNSIENLELDNSAGATIASGTLNITGTYTPTDGTLTTGDNLVLKSTVSGTGRIASGSSSGGYISGNITLERYIPGKRAFRFFAHPFTSAIGLSALTDDIDITGSGGATNGFTTTSTNSPSAFWLDPSASDNSTVGNNPGWKAFTNTNGLSTNSWDAYKGVRVLVRGTKGQGLTGGTYTPSAVTLDMSGTLNQGDITINLTKGSGSDFVIVGNPFASQVNMDAVSGTNLGSSFWIWDATQGTLGGYTSYSFGSSSFNLPSFGAFTTTLTSNGSIVFQEADKTSGAGGTMFKGTGTGNTVQLRIEDSTVFWDRLLLRFDSSAFPSIDYADAREFYNPDITFYTLSTEDSMLSIDSRPYADSSVIPLGIYTTLKKTLKIVAADFDMPPGTRLFLNDNYTAKMEEITGAGFEYWFTINTDSASRGNKRFELRTLGKPATDTPTSVAQAVGFDVQFAPNPTKDRVRITCQGGNSAEPLEIIIITPSGTILRKEVIQSNSKPEISFDTYPPGVYIIEVHNGNRVVRRKISRL